jgi:hypothetical protein
MPDISGLDPRFCEAWVNYEHRVCRVRLAPYSLHHALMLRMVGNPLVAEKPQPGEVIEWSDLWESVAICKGVSSQPIRYPSGWKCAFVQRLFRLDLAAEVEAFRAYQNDFAQVPDLHCSDPHTRTLTAPAPLAKVVSLARELREPMDHFWDMPLGKLEWVYATLQEQLSSRVSLHDEETGALFDLLGRIQRGEATPDELPPDPEPEKRRNKLMARARAMLTADTF